MRNSKLKLKERMFVVVLDIVRARVNLMHTHYTTLIAKLNEFLSSYRSFSSILPDYYRFIIFF